MVDHVSATLAAWGTPDFSRILQQVLEAMAPGELPLQRALARSSVVSPYTPHRVRVITCEEDAQSIRVKIGIFYAGIVAGCNCADDPSPPNEEHEYCEVALVIDKRGGAMQMTLLETE